MSVILTKDARGHWTNRLSDKPVEYKYGPKGSSWKLIYRRWRNGGSEIFEAFVSNYEIGLTAYEAYQKVKWNCDPQPAFHEVAFEQVETFPIPKTMISNGQEKPK